MKFIKPLFGLEILSLQNRIRTGISIKKFHSDDLHIKLISKHNGYLLALWNSGYKLLLWIANKQKQLQWPKNHQLQKLVESKIWINEELNFENVN